MQQEITPWIIDRFDDTKILRYEVNGFESLSLDDKLMVYYLAQAAKCGRDILFDQNFRFNLPLRRTLEAIYTTCKPSQMDEEWLAFERYLKHIWFANGVHHHYSGDKFRPSFSREFFEQQLDKVPLNQLPKEFGAKEQLSELMASIIFDEKLYAHRITRAEGVDIVAESSCNYYNGVSFDEAENFYALKEDPAKHNAPSWGLNTQLVKLSDGSIVERTYRLGGLYNNAIIHILNWLKKAEYIANEQTQKVIRLLVEFYLTGDLITFDFYSIEWLKDSDSRVDFINGFIEVYGDPLGRKGAWESLVNFRCKEATKRTEIIAAAAQWAEDNAPIPTQYRKDEVVEEL
ncbi:MAG: dihydrofolate reductase, partial [Rikenellaceae bacterium]